MNTKNAPLEVSGATVEEAIAAGLQQLNLPREAVEIEILDEGTRGLFGLGAREASVRLIPHPSGTETKARQPTPVKTTLNIEENETEEVADKTEDDEEAGLEDEELVEDLDDAYSMDNLLGDEETDQVLSVARDTVADLLQKMHVDADVTASYVPQEDERRNRPGVLVEIDGDDLSILIGRQAETLNALQYIARLIIGKELNQGIDLDVDVQGYRARRAEQLRRLARQMAEQAIRSGKRQYLEPMTANDRRLIHIELRKNPQVETESIGAGDRRKVTIVPK